MGIEKAGMTTWGNRWLGLFLLSMCLGGVVAAQIPIPAAQGVKLTWLPTLTAALDQAALDKKPILIDFSTDWHAESKKMDQETFADAGVQALLKDCILLRLNPDQSEENRKLADKLKVEEYPSTYFMNWKGEVIAGNEGYMDPVKCREFITRLLKTFKQFPLGYEEVRYADSDPVRELLKKLPADEKLSTEEGQICLLDQAEIFVEKDGSTTETSRMVSYVYNSDIAKLPQTTGTYNSNLQKWAFKSVRIMHKDGKGRGLDPALARDEHRYENQSGFWDVRTVSLDLPPLQNGDIVDVTFMNESKPILPGHIFYRWQCDAWATIKSDLRLVFPASLGLIRHLNNTPDRVVESKLPEDKVEWRLEADCPKTREEMVFCPPLDEVGNNAYFASKLEWNDVGKWFSDLCKGRDVLPEDARKRLGDLKLKSKTQKDLLKELQKWVTTEIRFIDLPFSLSSFQPHTITEILSNRYADRKDLAFVLKTFCREAGIEASLILLDAQYDHSVVGLPSPMWFDHVLVEATLGTEKFYIDPSMGMTPLGYLPAVCAKAQGLRIDPAGSALVRLPDYQDVGEGCYSKLVIRMNTDGSAEMWQYLVAVGAIAQQKKNSLSGESLEKMRRVTIGRYKASGQKLLDLNFTDPDEVGDKFEWRVRYTVPRFGQKIGPDLVLNPTRPILREKVDVVPLLQEARTVPFYFLPGDSSTEIIEINLPEKTVVKQNLTPVEIKTPFLTFNRKVTTDGLKITMTDKTRFAGGRLPANELKQVLDAFKKRRDALDESLVLTLPPAVAASAKP